MATYTTPGWVFCGGCGASYPSGQPHFCPAWAPPIDSGAHPVKQLTEDDVRRIIAEELEGWLERVRERLGRPK